MAAKPINGTKPSLTFTDRYGGKVIDPTTVCRGPCEGMGMYPKKWGRGYRFVKCKVCGGTGKRKEQ